MSPQLVHKVLFVLIHQENKIKFFHKKYPMSSSKCIHTLLMYIYQFRLFAHSAKSFWYIRIGVVKYDLQDGLVQSRCAAGYDDQVFSQNFKECWLKNPLAHNFQNGKTWKQAHTNVVLWVYLESNSKMLTNIKLKIKKWNPNLGTRDIITAIELGIFSKHIIFDFEPD